MNMISGIKWKENLSEQSFNVDQSNLDYLLIVLTVLCQFLRENQQ